MKIQKYRVHLSLAVTITILVVGLATIFWARGFKPDLKNGRIGRTGLIVANSIPTGAQVYLNDRLTSATDTSIAYLDPGSYKVKIQKDGYSVWEKQIEVRADLATEIKAVLFPTAPQISPLTLTGAANPTLSPDNTKIIYGVSGVRGGIYILPMSDSIFAFRQEARLLAKNQDGFDFSKAAFIFSPDSKQAIATIKNELGNLISNILVDTERPNQEIRDITGSLNATLENWQEELDAQSQIKAQIIPDEIKQSTAEAKTTKPSPSPTLKVQSTINKKSFPSENQQSTINSLNYFPTGLNFSPDEEKVMFTNKEGKYQVYDLKTKKALTLPEFSELISLSWFPDSNHLIVAQKNLISIIEADGTNKMVVYSGKFENARPPSTDAEGVVGRGFVFAHPSGQRLIILTPLTQADGTLPNLYSINLK